MFFMHAGAHLMSHPFLLFNFRLNIFDMIDGFDCFPLRIIASLRFLLIHRLKSVVRTRHYLMSFIFEHEFRSPARLFFSHASA